MWLCCSHWHEKNWSESHLSKKNNNNTHLGHFCLPCQCSPPCLPPTPCEFAADLCFSLVLNSLMRWLCWRGMVERWMLVCVSYRKGSLLTSDCFFLSWLEDEYSSSSALWMTTVMWSQTQKHLSTEVKLQIYVNQRRCVCCVCLLTPACFTSMWTSREANSKFSL